MTSPAWWTEADQAELDALLWAFLCVAEHHQQHCSGCGPVAACAAVRDAWDALEDWWVQRRLLSRAEWHRSIRQLETIDLRREANGNGSDPRAQPETQIQVH